MDMSSGFKKNTRIRRTARSSMQMYGARYEGYQKKADYRVFCSDSLIPTLLDHIGSTC